MPSPQERKEKPVTVQTGTKLEAFFAAFSRKTRVLRRKSHREAKPEFYGENPIAKRFGMGFSQATVHALDRACTVAETWKARLVCQESPPEK